jgi:arylsulfatase A-like enzyme
MVPYAEALDIPLIVRWPKRIEGGRRVDTVYTALDHLPTLCSMAGVQFDRKSVDGTDLSRIALGTGSRTGGDSGGREDALITNYVSHWDYFDSGTRWPEWRGVRTRRHTYAKWLTGKEELYDNVEDPYQMHNLVENAAHRKTLQALRGRLDELLAEAHDTFPPGTKYAEWYDDRRALLRTALGPVQRR